MGKYFFATRADLEPGLRLAESRLFIKYVKYGFHPTPQPAVYRSALDIPQFGISSYGRVYGMQYMALPAHAEVHVRPVPQVEGGILYSIDPPYNLGGFCIGVGGWYEGKMGKFLVGSEMGCYSDVKEIKTLYGRYVRTVTRGFVAVRDRYNQTWWVGSESMIAVKSGIRLVTDTARIPLHLQTYLSLNGYSHLLSRGTP